MPQSLLWPLLWPEILPSLPLRSTPSTTILSYSRATSHETPRKVRFSSSVHTVPGLLRRRGWIIRWWGCVVPLRLQGIQLVSGKPGNNPTAGLGYTPWTMSQFHLWHHRRKMHISCQQWAGIQGMSGRAGFCVVSSEFWGQGFCGSKAWLLAGCEAPLFRRALSQTKLFPPCDAREESLGIPHLSLLLHVPSGMTTGFRLLGALCVQCRGMTWLRCLTLTPGGLRISTFSLRWPM